MLVVRGRRVVLPDGIRGASLHLDGAVIARVGAYDDLAAGDDLLDAGDLTVSPGVVDTHVHVNEPGRTEWEGFETATHAAAAGGVTTIVDMPLNSVPATTSLAALEAKRNVAAMHANVDVAFWGGVVPGNADAIGPLISAGVRGFKCFLTPSGVSEFEAVSEHDLRLALPMLAACRPAAPLLVHAEDPSLIRIMHGDRRSYASYLQTRPPAAEVSAIGLIGALSAEYDVAAHIVHVSSAEGVEAIAALRGAGVRLTGETCPHYLCFAADDVPDGATAFKCAPPIREARHREALWAGLKDGTLQLVATDHSPAPPALKQLESGDFSAAWGGIASLQLSLPAVWTEARRRACSTHDLAGWLSAAPARLCGLGGRKGRLAPGYDADLVIWDPDASFVVRGRQLAHRHALTPYEGHRLYGVVHQTLVRGKSVWRDDHLERSGYGQLL